MVGAALLGGMCISVVLVSGCGTAQEVTSYRNPGTGQRTDLLSDNLLDAPGDTREMLWLNAYRDFKDQHHFKYYLEAIYGARQETGYLDINPGRSLTITADGHEMNFTGLGSLKKWDEKSAVFESARYEASADDIYRISRAKQVTVRVVGQNGIVVREFAAENFQRFRKFADLTGADL
jgi:hypothetical protein